MTSIALTVIGDDRAGLVSALATVVADHGGNWLESQMARLAGKFAGIALVDVPAANMAEFCAALDGLRADGLDITVTSTDAVDAAGETLVLQLTGNDRPGIVAQVSHALASLGVTIDELATGTVEAPMAGGLLFQADAIVRLPSNVTPDDVRAALEPLAGELMVDLEFSA